MYEKPLIAEVTNEHGTALLRCDFADSSFTVLIAGADGAERFRFAQ